MNNKREILGWAMYDWGNSAFASTVVTTFLGPYLATLIRAQGGAINVLGYPVEADAFFPFCISISVFLQVFFLPILGTLADYTRLKKPLMMTFAYTGATATILLFFVQGNLALLGGLLFLMANLAFGAAIVFYNAFLPDITGPDTRDAVSSRGFALGYLGGGIVLILNLLTVSFMVDTGLAVRLSLASAGVWWLVFTLFFSPAAPGAASAGLQFTGRRQLPDPQSQGVLGLAGRDVHHLSQDAAISDRLSGL